jgi:hypothetical protein
MAYFPDLSPYNYSAPTQPGVVHVGWLCSAHPYPKGSVAPHLIDKLKVLAEQPVELFRGYHVCDLCGPGITLTKERISNGEIRLTVCSFGHDDDLQGNTDPTFKIGIQSDLIFVRKVTYAAPVLIVHYVEAHNYLPPTEFLHAVEMHRID